MGSIVAALPPSLRTSTTGQGLAGLAAAAAGTVASHYTQNELFVALAAIVAGAIVLLIFPQSTGAPAMSVTLAEDIRPIVSAFRSGLEHGAALAAPPPAPGTEITTITETKEKTPP